jgi:glycosyltransferase involved in cell wall biosynthesis
MTDVAHFTARIVPELAKRVQLTLWAEKKQYDRRLEKYADVRVFSKAARIEFGTADLNVFNLGNDRAFHEKILRACLVQPGLIILHDLFLPSLARRNYQKVAAVDASDPFSFTRFVLSQALGVMVHTRGGFEALRGNGRLTVGFHPLPYSAGNEPPARSAQIGSPKRLIIFGFLDSNRRLESVLRALQAYPRKDNFRLDIFGTINKPRTFRRLVKALRLASTVIFHGFVSENELEKALLEADLAINLRYPTMGEASGSQLRIWDHALPSLVTPIGWYSELPSDTVGYVDPKNEIADLHFHFDKLQDDPEHYRKIGRCGREVLLLEHQPAAYARAIYQLAEKADLATQSATTTISDLA